MTLALLTAVLLLAPQEPAGTTFSAVDQPPAATRNPLLPSTRAPLRATPLVPLPIGAVRPRGWLGAMLRSQAEGFHGRLTEISEYLQKDGNAWLAPDGEGTHGWEEPVYWLKGFAACAYLLEDPRMLAETKVWIEAILASQKPDGWFGPDGKRSGKATDLIGRTDLWPNMIALYCLQDWHEHSGDPRVLELMQRYFDYLRGIPDEQFLVGYWPPMRGGDLLFSIYWLHQRTGAEDLLELAAKVHRRTAKWSEGVIDWHNVNMAQGVREPATWWLQSGVEADRRASYALFDEMRRTYGQVPGGMFGGDENCRPGFTGPRQAIETCGMVEMMLSLETLAWITGDPLWADRCEDVAFNSLPAATTADLRALRYLTAPNMVLSDAASKAPGLQNGGPMLLMNPHRHRCCQHDFGHGWPYFGKHAWFASADRGAVAMLFTDCSVSLPVGDGRRVTIDEETRYPFDGRIRFTVRTEQPIAFPLYLRIPGWCEKAGIRSVAADGSESRDGVSDKAGGYVRVDRVWKDGDRIELELAMSVRIRRWTDNFGTASVDRGPLTYSLEIGEELVRHGGTDDWPAFEIHPTTPWNYALAAAEPAAFEVLDGAWPADDRPFSHEGTPIRLRTQGRRVPAWQLDHLGLCMEVQQSPVRTAEPLETITLIPMGAARLRISAFPVAVADPDDPAAHTWAAPPEPAFRASASHCFGNDTPLAMADGLLPQSSSDQGIARHTFWDHRGTREWIQAEFDAPREVSAVGLYWFDDGPRGGCRVPASWRLLWRDGERWVPVAEPGAFGTAKDRFNEVLFATVRTTALRAEIVLQDGFSAGVLEWRIE
jgi:DUF1680 family protein